MTQKVAIVTDSIACLTRELVEQYGIEILPINFYAGGKIYRDWIDITPSEAYELFLKEKPAKAEKKSSAAVPSMATASQQTKEVRSNDSGAYAVFDKAQTEAQQKAENDVMEIYTMLENNQIQQAYEYFKKNQIPLKTYIYGEAYQALESAISDAYKSFNEDSK